MTINRDINGKSRSHAIKVAKGTKVDFVDSVAKGDGKEWIEVVLPDGKHVDVPASAVSK